MFANTKIFAITLLAASFPVAVLAEEPHCETSSGSPDTGSVTDVINEARGKDGNHQNLNAFGSHCTNVVEHNEAAIALCGDTIPLSGAEVASMANDIQQTSVAGWKGRRLG